MEQQSSTVLIVDDEPFNVEILVEHLEEKGYQLETAGNGLEAWELLERAPDRFHAVLLDRMMPEMDGLEVLKKTKAHPELKTLPVIMQTAKASKQEVLEGLQAGTYYYLTKPYDKDQLLAIVDTAVNDCQKYRSLQAEVQQTTHTLTYMNKGQFSIRTLDESRNLITLLSNAIPDGSKIVMGLMELVTNAIEHGNLGITYEDKTWLLEQGEWENEVQRRLALPKNKNKRVTLEFERSNDNACFLIQDEGDGFDWQDYLEISPDRVFDTHGRGIAMARMLSFDHLEYQGNGNRVVASIQQNKTG